MTQPFTLSSSGCPVLVSALFAETGRGLDLGGKRKARPAPKSHVAVILPVKCKESNMDVFAILSDKLRSIERFHGIASSSFAEIRGNPQRRRYMSARCSPNQSASHSSRHHLPRSRDQRFPLRQILAIAHMPPARHLDQRLPHRVHQVVLDQQVPEAIRALVEV